MDKITDLQVEPLTNSRFVKPLRLRFKQDGKVKVWDLIQCHASVAVVIFNQTTQKFVFVRQFRPAVYFSALRRAQGDVEPGTQFKGDEIDPKVGITLELCAGIVDKSKSLIEIAHEEILEETGYDVPMNLIEEIQTFPVGVGVGGENMTLFCAEVTEAMRKGPGGGLAEEGEMIDVIEMGVEETRTLMRAKSVTLPPGALYGLSWYFMNKR